MSDPIYLGVYLQSMLDRGFHQGVAEELVVRVGSKDDLAVIAALDDVLGLAGNNVAGKAGHDAGSLGE